MSADLTMIDIDPAPRCPQCGRFGELGYLCIDGIMRWFCAEHRLARFWADARMPSPLSHSNKGTTTDVQALPATELEWSAA
jgi:hypothetical protein